MTYDELFAFDHAADAAAEGQVQAELRWAQAGKYTYSLYYMSNSYMGCDQDYNFSIETGEAANGDEGSGLDSN